MSAVFPLELVELPFRYKNLHMVQYPCPDALDGPIMVSSSRSFFFLPPPSRSYVRIGVRKDKDAESLLVEMVCMILAKAQEESWPTLQPTEAAAVAYFNDRGVGSVERRQGGWSPAGWVVFYPTDVSFVGTMLRFPEGSLAVFIHSVSEGLVFVPETSDGLAGKADT